jgi:hypothetical protein
MSRRSEATEAAKLRAKQKTNFECIFTGLTPAKGAWIVGCHVFQCSTYPSLSDFIDNIIVATNFEHFHVDYWPRSQKKKRPRERILYILRRFREPGISKNYELKTIDQMSRLLTHAERLEKANIIQTDILDAALTAEDIINNNY